MLYQVIGHQSQQMNYIVVSERDPYTPLLSLKFGCDRFHLLNQSALSF